MGTERWSLLFRPGTYGTDAEPLQIKVGYYTEVAGLGASPSDTVINGKVEVYNRCLTDGPTQPYCVALNNFWRSMSNLTIQVNGVGPGRLPRLRQLLGRLAGVLPAPRRRPRRQPLADGLLHRGPAVRQRRLPRQLACGRDHQRVAAAVDHPQLRGRPAGPTGCGTRSSPAPSAPRPRRTSPTQPYTTLETTPVSREKPFLYVDPAGRGRCGCPAPGPTRAAPTGPRGTARRTQPPALRLPRRPSDRLRARARLAARPRQAPAPHPRGVRRRPQPRGPP